MEMQKWKSRVGDEIVEVPLGPLHESVVEFTTSAGEKHQLMTSIFRSKFEPFIERVNPASIEVARTIQTPGNPVGQLMPEGTAAEVLALVREMAEDIESSARDAAATRKAVEKLVELATTPPAIQLPAKS